MTQLQTINQRIVVVGATSSIAEHCLRQWLQAGPADVVLLGRDEVRLRRVAADLAVRSPRSTFEVKEANFLDSTSIDHMVGSICAVRTPDLALIAHGSLPDQETCQVSLQATQQALEINGVSPCLFAEALVNRMQSAGHGKLVMIGSVAGDRGRKSNYVYGAAKGLVARYAQGLQHRLANSNTKVILVKPGPTTTPMTAHLDGRGPALAKVEDVARAIVMGVAKDKPVIYAPGKWWFIMMVIRHLPAFVFNRMNI